MAFYIDLHALVDANITVEDGHMIGHNLKDEIQKRMPEVQEVLIHIEPFNLISNFPIPPSD